jgi:hypothetical protein
MQKMEYKELRKRGLKELKAKLKGLFVEHAEIIKEFRYKKYKGQKLKDELASFIIGKAFVRDLMQESTATEITTTVDYSKPKPEIQYIKDTFEEYLGKKTHISASDIKNFLHSPRYYFYKAFEEVKQPNKENERHFPIGSAVHEVILEPELFKSNYIIAPKFDMRTLVGKQGYAEFLVNSNGKTILFEDEYTMAVKMGVSASQNDTFVDLIKDSYRELSCYTTDEKTGLPLRMRPDSFSKTKSTITDIKTCRESSPSKFKWDVRSFGYAISSAFYMDFLKRENYVFCAIEKSPPYETALYVLDDEMTEYGRTQYRMGLDLIKWSMDNNYWCSYNEFEILKECYELGNLDEFFQIKEASEKITILK